MTSSVYLLGKRPDGKIGVAGLDNNNNLTLGGGSGSAGSGGSATSPLIVSSLIARLSTEVTRPAGTLTYAAGQAVASLVTLVGAGRAVGGSGYVTLVRLGTNNPLSGVFRVYILSAAPTVAADAAQFNLMYVDTGSPGKIVGWTDISVAPEGSGGDSAWGFDAFVRWPYVCGAAVSDLYAQIVARGSYAATASQKFTVGIGVEKT